MYSFGTIKESFSRKGWFEVPPEFFRYAINLLKCIALEERCASCVLAGMQDILILMLYIGNFIYLCRLFVITLQVPF